MDIHIYAKSSSNPESPYDVHFLYESDRLSIHCTCQAGSRGKLCKHKIAFIAGDEAMLCNRSDKAKLVEVQDLIRRTSLQGLFTKYSAIEENLSKLKAEMDDIKRKLEKAMNHGVS